MLLHDESPAAVEARDERFILSTYARTPLHLVHGSGARVVDADGKEYWDLLSGIAVNALGHAHPALVHVLEEEASSILHTSNLFYHPAPGLLAQKLIALTGLSKVFFCNSGTEANEAALKLVRLANPGRKGIVALEGGFHGRTIGALSLTGQTQYRTPFEPLLSNVRFIAPNDVESLEASISADTAAIFLEPILGEGGVVPLTNEFLQAASKLSDHHGAFLVVDEIQTGVGRTGEMFAYEHAGITPDIVTLAKPIGGGLPLGAAIVSARVASAVKPGVHGTTFGGNPLACRLGLAVLETIEAEKLVARAARLGEWFEAELKKLADETPAIAAVRGRGLMWGIELNVPAKQISNALLQHGFIVGTAKERVLRLLPPYIVPEEALTAFIGALGLLLQSMKEQRVA